MAYHPDVLLGVAYQIRGGCWVGVPFGWAWSAIAMVEMGIYPVILCSSPFFWMQVFVGLLQGLICGLLAYLWGELVKINIANSNQPLG